MLLVIRVLLIEFYMYSDSKYFQVITGLFNSRKIVRPLQLSINSTNVNIYLMEI